MKSLLVDPVCFCSGQALTLGIHICFVGICPYQPIRLIIFALLEQLFLLSRFDLDSIFSSPCALPCSLSALAPTAAAVVASSSSSSGSDSSSSSSYSSNSSSSNRRPKGV